MRFSLLVHYPNMSAELPEEHLAAGRAAFDAYAQALDDAGVLIAAEIFQPPSASSEVGAPLTSQGSPSGVIVLDVPDLADALSWARNCPAAEWGTVEVRPAATSWLDGRWTSAP